MEYDYSTGLVKKQTDANGNITEIDYLNQRFKDASITRIDLYGRPGVVTSPAVTSTVNGTTTANQKRTAVSRYFDSARQVEVHTDLRLQDDHLLKSRTTSDQLGRVVKTESSENGTSYTISSETVYKYKPGGQNGMADRLRVRQSSSGNWNRSCCKQSSCKKILCKTGTGQSFNKRTVR